MNIIENMFYDSLNTIINSNSEKTYTLDTGEEIKYRFYHRDYTLANCRALLVTRPEVPKSDCIIDSFIIFDTNDNCDCVIKGYKPDFMFSLGSSGYAIEIDGFEWHEKTKEQAIYDRRKDRTYIKSGYIPVRFLGSEVYHDPKKCSEEFIELMIENELSLFDRDSIMKIDITKCCLESNLKDLNNCLYGNGTIPAFYLDEKKFIINPLQYLEKNRG